MTRFRIVLAVAAQLGVMAAVAAADAPASAVVAPGEPSAGASAGTGFALGASVLAGGGDAQGGAFTSTVTIGQPVADGVPMSGGAFEAITGFWPAVTAAPRADLVFAGGFESS